MFKTPQPDGVLPAAAVKEAADSVVGELPLPGIEGAAADDS